jgi:hypothetical protein
VPCVGGAQAARAEERGRGRPGSRRAGSRGRPSRRPSRRVLPRGSRAGGGSRVVGASLAAAGIGAARREQAFKGVATPATGSRRAGRPCLPVCG